MSPSGRALLTVVLALAGLTVGEPADARPDVDASKRSESATESLTRAVEAVVRERVGGESRVVVRQLVPPPGTGRVPRNPSLTLASPNLASGWLTFRLAQPSGDTWVRAEVAVDVPTVVAARAVERGDVLTADALTFDWRPLSDRAVTQLEVALGAVTRQPLAAGDPIPGHALDRPLAIERGDRVDALLVGSGYAITVEAEALARGRVGDIIEVRTKVARPASVRALVTGPRQVEVR
jgi:flagella basal body P-ring formation protein FlgA